jgi:hypothetical protein
MPTRRKTMSTHSRRVGLSAFVVLALAISACGTTPGDRALSGGLLGAGTGAAIGSVTGSAGRGAIIGGVGGAAIGALTSPNSLNLGTPPWRSASRSTHTRTAYAGRCVLYSSTTGRCLRHA